MPVLWADVQHYRCTIQEKVRAWAWHTWSEWDLGCWGSAGQVAPVWVSDRRAEHVTPQAGGSEKEASDT